MATCALIPTITLTKETDSECRFLLKTFFESFER